MARFTFLATLAALATACASSPGAMQSITGEWSLVELVGADIAALDAERRPNLTIGDTDVRGFGGVNRFSAKLDAERLTRGEFAAGPALATRMSGPAEAMAAEQKLFAALAAGCPVEIRADELLLLAADGGALARFVRK